MTEFADFFPLIVAVVLLLVAIAALRLNTKISRGSLGAGPIVAPEGSVPGLNATAWDLRSIEADLELHPRHALTMVYELCQQVDLSTETTSWDERQSIDELLARLESHLGIESRTQTSLPTHDHPEPNP